MSIRIVFVLLTLFTTACSLDASLTQEELASIKGATSKSITALQTDRQLIFTEFVGTNSYALNNSALFTPSANPAAVNTTTAKALGDVTVIAAPTVVSDIKPYIRHTHHDSPQPQASGTSAKENFDDTATVTLSPVLEPTLLPTPTATSCEFQSPMPHSICQSAQITLSLQDFLTDTLAVQFDNGQSFSFSMQRYEIAELELGVAGNLVGSRSEAREEGGPFEIDLVSVGASDYTSSRTYLHQPDGQYRLVFNRPSNYDFLKVAKVMSDLDLVFYLAYKPTVDRVGLYVSDKALSYFRMVANLNPASDDLSQFFRYDFVPYNNKIYFTLDYTSYRTKLFRMDLDATNVEQVTDFVPAGNDGIFGLTTHNGKLYFGANIGSTTDTSGKLFFLQTDPDGSNLAISRFPSRNTTNSDVGSIDSLNGRLYVNWSSGTESGLHWISDDHSQITKITDFADNYSLAFTRYANTIVARMDESLTDDRNSLFLFNPITNQFTLLADLRPQGNGYNWKSGDIIVSNTRIFFKHRGTSGTQLLSSALDGSDLRAETALKNVSNLAQLGDRIFFLGFDSNDNDKLYSVSTSGGDLQQHSNLNPGGPDFVQSSNGLELYRRNDSTLLLAWDATAFEIKLVD